MTSLNRAERLRKAAAAAEMGATNLIRIDWSTKKVVSGWTFDLTPFGILDCRAVAKIRGRFFVSDGSESRPSEDPLRHAVFVLNVKA